MNAARGAGPPGWFRVLEPGLLVVIPLAFWRGFLEQFSYPKIFLTKVFVLSGLVVWGLTLLWRNQAWPSRFRMAFPLAMLGFTVLLSTTNSPVPRFSLWDASYFLCGPLWLWLLVSSSSGKETLKRCAAYVAVAGALVAMMALFQWAGFDPLLSGGYRVEWGTMVARMRLYSTMGNPNFVAGHLIGAIFPAMALGISSANRWAKSLAWLAAMVMGGAIVGARSRGAWVGFTAGLFVAVYVWSRKQRIAAVETQPNVGASPARGLFAPTVFFFLFLFLNGVVDTLLRRLEGRVYLWRCSWPMFSEHPLLGAGWGTFQLRFLDLQAGYLAGHPEMAIHWSNIRQLHNDLLQLLLETGVVGSAAFVWVLWAFGQEVLRGLKNSGGHVWSAASAGGVTAILVDSFFNFQFAVPPTLVLLFTLMAFPSLLVRAQGIDAHEAPRVSSRQPMGSQLWRGLASALLVAVGLVLLIQVARQASAEHDAALALDLEEVEDLAGAEQIYRHGVALNPLNGKLRFGLARVLYRQEKFTEALGEALLAEHTYRDSHLEVLKARIQDRMGHADAALASYRRALTLDPTLKTVQADIQRLEK